MALTRGVFAAGLVVPQGGIALGEVRPGEVIEKTVVISNDAERTIAVSRVKACCGGEATMVPMSVPAKGEAKLTLRIKAQIPGEIAKAVSTVTIRTSRSSDPGDGNGGRDRGGEDDGGRDERSRQAWVNIPRGQRPSCRRQALCGVHP